MRILIIAMLVAFTMTGCIYSNNIQLFPDGSSGLQEFTIQGSGEDKILLIPMKGEISDEPEAGLFASKPGTVQYVASRLKLAENDSSIKAVVIKIDSPGGAVTASDIIYNELLSFKQRTGKKVVIAMMNMATSGAYYISLPADYIFAHPTTITGSVGVIFMRPNFSGLMNKIGVRVDVNKSGLKKDYGSPLRENSEDEFKYYQNMTDALAERFYSLVRTHRKISDKDFEEVKSAAVFLAPDAVKLGLIDEVGYLSDAFKKAASLSGISYSSRIVVYRKGYYGDDTVYNNAEVKDIVQPVSLINAELPSFMITSPGYYYISPLGVE